MNEHIRRLTPDEFPKCGNIWDMERHADLAERFLSELQSGNRLTWVYEQDGHFLGEISLVKDTPDPDYTIPGRRIYVSRLIVRKENRRQGIGKTLVESRPEDYVEKWLETVDRPVIRVDGTRPIEENVEYLASVLA